MKRLVIFLGGIGDRPCKQFGGKTPLEYAETPNLNILTKKGSMGYMYPIKEGFVPDSDNALVSILGNGLKTNARGQFEALGLGIRLKRGDLALRTNFATIDNLKNRRIIDRRAGRTLSSKEAEQLAKALNDRIKLPTDFKFYSSVQHRGLLIFKGGFSDDVSNTDAYQHGDGKILLKEKFQWSSALDDDENAEFSVNLINSFVDQSFKILSNHPINQARVKRGLMPANILLTRDAGIERPKLRKLGKSMFIVNMPLQKGIGLCSGADVYSVDYPKLRGYDVYENLHDGLNKMIKFSIKTIKRRGKRYHSCIVYFKETDIAGHDNKPYEKKNFIEMLDQKFFSFIRKYIANKDIKVVVMGDHSTPCKLKAHSSDPVPLLIYDPSESPDTTSLFSEAEGKKGKLGKLLAKNFVDKIGLV